MTIPPPRPRNEFLLFVFRDSLESNRAIANLRRIGEELLDGDYDLEVIDVLEDPEAAEHHSILSTPTLVVRKGWPQRRMTGDLSSYDRVASALELSPTRPPGARPHQGPQPRLPMEAGPRSA